MNKGKNILMFALPRHDDQFNSTSWQLATQFVKLGYRVMYVDNSYTLFDLMRGVLKIEIWKALINTLFPTWINKEGVEVLPPMIQLPVNFLPEGGLYRLLNSANQLRLASLVNHHLRRRSVYSYILVNSFNFYLNRIQDYLIPYRKFIYHCIDPMIKPYTLKHGLEQEKQLAYKADLVICTAPALADKFRAWGLEVAVVPNGANVERCSQALDQNTVEWEQIKKINGPVMGYLGNIERRIDYELLRSVLELLPDWNLVMVGPSEDRYIPDWVSSHPRICLPGAVSPNMIPSVFKGFDVGIIPFRVDEVSRGIFPLKLYEYLAAGLPVISTSFNEDIFQNIPEGCVHVAADPGSFAAAISEDYHLNSQDMINLRSEHASAHSWSSRAETFLEHISHEVYA